MTEEGNNQQAKRFCACGCGQEVYGFNYVKHEPVKFKHGHHSRGNKYGVGRFRERNNRWTGGSWITNYGYRMIRLPEHPRASNGYVLEHIIVMEKKIGRPLLPDEVVHHINGNKLDNRPENLDLFSSHSKHMVHECNLRYAVIRNETTLCACGCGILIKVRDGHGRKRKFISGHNLKLMKLKK